MWMYYRIISDTSDESLKESVRIANLLGEVAVGPVIEDGLFRLQVVKKLRDGYVNADGTIPAEEGGGGNASNT